MLVPMLAVNILNVVSDAVMETVSLWSLSSFSDFVCQLVVFYFVFWAVFRIPVQGLTRKHRMHILCVCVVTISLLIYVTEGFGILKWPTESFGFLYGILLAEYADLFNKKFSQKWILKCVAVFVLTPSTKVRMLPPSRILTT